MKTALRLRIVPCGARIPIYGEAPILLSHAPAQLLCVVARSLNTPVCNAAELITTGKEGHTHLMKRHWFNAGVNRGPYGYVPYTRTR